MPNRTRVACCQQWFSVSSVIRLYKPLYHWCKHDYNLGQSLQNDLFNWCWIMYLGGAYFNQNWSSWRVSGYPTYRQYGKQFMLRLIISAEIQQSIQCCTALKINFAFKLTNHLSFIKATKTPSEPSGRDYLLWKVSSTTFLLLRSIGIFHFSGK